MLFLRLADHLKKNGYDTAIIDYSDELIGARFVIDNPNATSSCGCGTSFSI